MEISEAWLEAHAAFHRTLLQACPNTWLTKTADLLRDSTEIYRCWSAQFGHERNRSGHELSRDVASEHRRILNAALARDADEAAAALSEHIERTTKILLLIY